MTTVKWERPGLRIVQGKGDDGCDYSIDWHFKEVSLGESLKGPKSLVGGQYSAFQDGQEIGVYDSLADAVAAIEKAVPNVILDDEDRG